MKHPKRLLVLVALLSTSVVMAPSGAVSLALAAPRSDEGGAVRGAVAADRRRIQAHLERVERELRARDTTSLAPTARSARARALDALHGYWHRGVFPQNTRHPGERMPYFIDDEGRACAVAHLMQVSGSARLAETVRARENNARVAAMTTDLGPWLEQNGLTAEEAARIQPSYCACGDVVNPVCAEVRGEDGGLETRTYMNECIATMCSETIVLHDGECEPGDELADAACDYVVCKGEPQGCSLGPAARRRGAFGASLFGAGMLGFFVVLLRRRRRRAR